MQRRDSVVRGSLDKESPYHAKRHNLRSSHDMFVQHCHRPAWQACLALQKELVEIGDSVLKRRLI